MKAPGVAAAFLALAVMDAAPRLLGLKRAIELARKLGGRAGRDTEDAQLVNTTVHRLATAAALYPRRALCLEQSLALFVLLRRCGVPADLKLGVQPLPFYAHAWVELNGRALNERQGHVEQLVPFHGVGH